MVTNVQNMISFPKCFNAYTSTLITASFIEALNQKHRIWYFLKNQETVQLKWLTVSRSYSYNFDYQVYEEVLGQADPKSLWFFFIPIPLSFYFCLSFYLYFYLSTFLSLSGRTCHTLWDFSDFWVSCRKAWLTRYSVLYPPPVTTVTSSNLQSTCPRALFRRKCFIINMCM